MHTFTHLTAVQLQVQRLRNERARHIDQYLTHRSNVVWARSRAKEWDCDIPEAWEDMALDESSLAANARRAALFTSMRLREWR